MFEPLLVVVGRVWRDLAWMVADWFGFPREVAGGAADFWGVASVVEGEDRQICPLGNPAIVRHSFASHPASR
jgi:hypothetical protein